MALSTKMGATALTDRGAAPWPLAEERLRNPERPRTYWLVLPGMLGMEQFEPNDLPRPTRWDRG
jgi:hypothetical protein